MYKKDVVIVFGYNNTRVDDVAAIRQKVKDELNAELLLCQTGLSKKDQEVADYLLDIPLLDIEKGLMQLEAWRKEKQKKIIAVLPFSDKGVSIGAAAAEKYGIFGDSFERAGACLDKYFFRELERDEKNLPNWYKKPLFKLVKSKDEVLSLLKSSPGKKFFIKPTSEGNSRGCCVIEDEEDLVRAWDFVKCYLPQGIMLEEYIDGIKEYSYDSVAGFCWITEKETTPSKYRAEYQQIVPAPIDDIMRNRFIEGGKIISKISGSYGGAVHNEFFMLPNNGIAAVEPNRRPAGAKIWDLAQLAFDGFKPWETWINLAAGKKIEPMILKRKCFAGSRCIAAKKEGIIKSISYEPINKLMDNHPNINKIILNVAIGQKVVSIQTNNADYVGYVIATHEDINELKLLLNKIDSLVGDAIDVE